MMFNMLTKSFLLIFSLFLFANADTLKAKVQSKLQPGKYILDRGNGELTIRLGEQGKLIFEIESVGSNCSSCSVSGVVLGTVGYADSLTEDDNESKCEISFVANRSEVVVHPLKHEECRTFCGARAGFDGIYSIPPKECTEVGKQKIHNQFLRLYRSRNFVQAEATLQSHLKQCSTFMNWIEIDEVRNDLALAQYHNGEFQQCLVTLNDTLTAKVKDEAELKEGKDGFYLPPCDFDNYIHVAKLTWFNKALCTKAILSGK